MSDAVSALGGVQWNEGIARIEELGSQGMITLRGDLGATSVRKAATGIAAVDMPARGTAHFAGQRGLCWMSPDELLVLCPYGDVDAGVAQMRETLGNTHALVVDVSDARAMFRLSGPHAREVLAKLVPVDLAPEVFGAGMFRRTRMAQVPAAFWLGDEDSFQIICFRSHAQYVFDLLKTAAMPGSAVDRF